MPRAKRGFKRRQRVKKVFDRSEGFVMGSRKIFRRASEMVLRAHKFAYASRRRRKRDFRALWITRISAATRIHDLSYSRFISALDQSNVLLNRKMLADIAVKDPKGFESIVQSVQAAAPKL